MIEIKYVWYLDNSYCREQWNVIHSIVFEKRDNCAVMTTGTDVVYSLVSSACSLYI